MLFGCAGDLDSLRDRRRNDAPNAGGTSGPTGASQVADASTPVDAAADRPCPALEPEDQGLWQWFPEHRYCVYSNRRFATLATHDEAKRYCARLGAFMPSANDLKPFCGDLLFRPGATNGGKQVWTTVWITDRCSDNRYSLYRDLSDEDDGKACNATGCASEDSERYFACMKRIE